MPSKRARKGLPLGSSILIVNEILNLLVITISAQLLSTQIKLNNSNL